MPIIIIIIIILQSNNHNQSVRAKNLNFASASPNIGQFKFVG